MAYPTIKNKLTCNYKIGETSTSDGWTNQTARGYIARTTALDQYLDEKSEQIAASDKGK